MGAHPLLDNDPQNKELVNVTWKSFTNQVSQRLNTDLKKCVLIPQVFNTSYLAKLTVFPAVARRNGLNS